MRRRSRPAAGSPEPAAAPQVGQMRPTAGRSPLFPAPQPTASLAATRAARPDRGRSPAGQRDPAAAFRLITEALESSACADGHAPSECAAGRRRFGGRAIAPSHRQWSKRGADVRRSPSPTQAAYLPQYCRWPGVSPESHPRERPYLCPSIATAFPSAIVPAISLDFSPETRETIWLWLHWGAVVFPLDKPIAPGDALLLIGWQFRTVRQGSSSSLHRPLPPPLAGFWQDSAAQNLVHSPCHDGRDRAAQSPQRQPRRRQRRYRRCSCRLPPAGDRPLGAAAKSWRSLRQCLLLRYGQASALPSGDALCGANLGAGSGSSAITHSTNSTDTGTSSSPPRPSSKRLSNSIGLRLQQPFKTHKSRHTN